MEVCPQTGIHALQLLLIPLQPGNICVGTVDVVPVVIVDKGIVDRTPDDISPACDPPHGKVLRTVRTYTIFDHLPDKRAVLMIGILIQVFPVHEPKRFLLRVALHHFGERRRHKDRRKAAVLILLEQAGDIVHLIYDPHKMLMRYIAIEMIQIHNLAAHPDCLPSSLSVNDCGSH